MYFLYIYCRNAFLLRMALLVAPEAIFRIFSIAVMRPLQKNTLKKRPRFQIWIKQVLKRL